jgi:hypothetical protein
MNTDALERKAFKMTHFHCHCERGEAIYALPLSFIQRGSGFVPRLRIHINIRHDKSRNNLVIFFCDNSCDRAVDE